MIEKLLKPINNIDKLMTQKLEDYVLTDEKPLSIQVGNKILFIGNLTLNNNYLFFHLYGKLMSHLGLKYIDFEHLNNGKELYTLCLKNKKWYKGITKIIKKTLLKQQAYYLNKNKDRKILKWVNMSWRYFKKNITVEKLMQIIMLIYFYNFDSEKKKLPNIVSKDGKRIETTYGDIYVLLASEFGWSDREISTCPVNKSRLLLQRISENKRGYTNKQK